MLLQGIPEQIAVAALAFVIAKIPLKWNKVVLIGIILAFCAYVVRLLPIPFGIHLILLIVLLFIALLWLGKGDFSLSLIACLLSFLALVIFEYVCLSLLMPVFGLTPESLSTDLVKRIVIGEFHVFLLFITAFLLNKFYKKDVE
ncbi:membrane protein [Desulfosporosinus sp. Tol-M]|nr:membrane protein [Desulfosporosinus sp. Tol-M]